MKAADFESAASTNSATRAGSFKGCNVTTFCSIEKAKILNKFSKLFAAILFRQENRPENIEYSFENLHCYKAQDFIPFQLSIHL